MSTKKCMKCKKEIHESATKCRYCKAEQQIGNNDIIITTATTVEGYEIIEHLGVLTGEIVCPDGVFGAITNGTFFTVSALADARTKALEALTRKAKIEGANALIGVDIDISTLPGGVLVSANGTAVYIDRLFSNEYLEERKQREEEAKIEQEKKDAEMALLREQKMEELKANGVEGLVTYCESLNSAMSIYAYVKELDCSDPVMSELLEACMKAVEFEKFYGNAKDSTIRKIKRILGIEE